ncbi:MAG: hypothetical protein K2K97_06850, partial [Muribaculaceae bacterium]|nr:hypothetical protein [Muribaculaceae bacterium]
NGNDIGVPDYDWVAHFYTISKTVQFTASCINGIYTNCFDDNGQLHIICNNHSLPCGSLQCEFIADIPNAIYPDGSEKIVSPQCVDIELVKGKGDCATSIEVQLQLPMLKGAPFTYDDFTPEQLEQLKGPQGNPGKDGASAYDQALAGGYTGTEQEFIESLSQINEMVRHESTDNELEAIEPNIATDALRKTEQLLTEAEQNQVLKNLGNPERQLFDDMWISAGNIDGRQYSSIDHENHPYTPYILNDIFHTYEEAVYTFIKTAVNYEADLISMFNGDKKLKTNFPIPGGRLTDNNSTNMFNGCSSLEVVVVSTNYCNPNKASNWFNGCTNLREIRGLISYSYANYSY